MSETAMFPLGGTLIRFEGMTMLESTDTRGLGRALCVALMAAAVSGCATLSAVDAPDYDDSMAAAETAMLGDDAAAAIQAYQRAAEAAPAQPLPWLEIAE